MKRVQSHADDIIVVNHGQGSARMNQHSHEPWNTDYFNDTTSESLLVNTVTVNQSSSGTAPAPLPSGAVKSSLSLA
jgi:hypothetical protein